MKQFIVILLLTGSIYQSFAQNNTFPTPSGDVGIGTTSPPTKLAVHFTLTEGQTNGIQLKSNSSLYAQLSATGPTYSGYGVGANEINLNSQGGHLSIGPASGHDLKFMSTGAEKMRLLSNGNFAIGTPYGTGGRLTITGGALPSAPNGGALNFSSALAAGRLSAGDGQNITAVMNTYLDASNVEISTGTTSGQVSGITMGGLSSTATSAAGAVRFWTSSAERMRISSTGYVGIGTTNPLAKLAVSFALTTTQSNGIHIRSNEALFADLIATGPTYNSYGVAGNEIWLNSQAGNLVVGPATNHDVKFVANGTEKMRLKANGNFGIGINNPTAKLSFGNAQTTTAGSVGTVALYESGNNKYGVSVNDQGFIDISGNATNLGGIRFFNGTDNTAPTERMRITSTGNVGIGTPSPSTKLSFGNAQTTTAGSVGTVALYESGNNKYGVSVNNQGFIDISGNATNLGGIRFFNGTDNTAPTERMRITPTGNVGIGITNPQAKLAVNGDIYAKKVKVTTTGWPDFVFEKNYVLKPLSEVEAFITINKHLPEVPSAADIAKNDQDLGEMNKVLLQKVEELTLYLIALEKENKLQKDRVDNLEKLVNTK